MAKFKAYTDEQQSKKLAKILPLESSDMLWGYWYNGENHCVPNIRPFRDQRDKIPNGYIPAWSLAALLGVLPNYQLQTQDDGIGILCSCNGKFNIVTADNPVDAYVAMIEKLHEQKLLWL